MSSRQSGASDKAYEDAQTAAGTAGRLHTAVRRAMAASHDPKLGLDRSVCLRDVVEAIHARWADTESGILCSDFREAAEFLKREFGAGHE